MGATCHFEVEELVQEILDEVDPEVMSAPDGLGIKACVGELISDDFGDGKIVRVFLQFYVQCVIPLEPKDVEFGYTNQDVIVERGVVLADVEDATDPPHYIGQTMSPHQFIETFISTPAVRVRIEELMTYLEQQAFPTESWLDQVSSLYNDRIPGIDWITNLKRIN